MDLAQLLEREALDGDAVLAWARTRGDQLIGALGKGDPLREYLGAAAIPPPPEHTGLVAGEPEPVIDTFQTGAIDLEDYRARVAAEDRRVAAEDDSDGPAIDIYGDVDVEFGQVVHPDEPERRAAEPVAHHPIQDAVSDLLGSEERGDDGEEEELEVDELVELDGEELELLDEDEDEDDDEQTGLRRVPAGPPPIKNEIASMMAELSALGESPDLPVQTGDTVANKRIDQVSGAPQKPTDSDDIDIDVE